MTVSYEVAGQKRPVTCPKLPRFPAHPAAAKKSESERVNVEDLIIKIDVTTGREQRAARRRFEQYARGIGHGQDLYRVRPLGLPIATYEMEAEKYIYRVYKYEL